MRRHLPASILSSLLALLVLSGCNSAYREAMSRAEQAAIRGDTLSAAIAYRSACAASPGDEKACGRAAIFAQKATDEALATARPACEAGDLDTCLPPLLAARDLIPDHPEVNALLESASQLHAERCSQWQAEGPLATAAAGLTCLQSRSAQLPVPSYQALLAQRASQLASRFAELASTAQGPGSAGASSVLWSAAQCLAPGTDTGIQASQALQGFLAQSAIPLAVRAGGTIPPPIAGHLSSLCESVSANVAPAARCAVPGAVPGQPEPLEIYVSAFMERAVERVWRETRSLSYVSGTRYVPNPEYAAALESLRQAESSMLAAGTRKKDTAEECEEARRTHSASCAGCEPDKKSPCDEAKEAAEELEARAREYKKARRYLNVTPETLPEDVYDTFEYPVMTHRWAMPYRFTVQSGSPGSIPSPQQAGELRFEDQEHVGFGPGGLNPDPLEVPSARAYANAFIQQAAPHVFAAVQQASIARGAARRAQCSALPEDWDISWVQCWAEASLWESGREPQAAEFLAILAASAGASSQPVCR
jgi:hypothetical protein